MNQHYRLGLALAVAATCTASLGQSVRASSETFHVPPVPLALPVAPLLPPTPPAPPVEAAAAAVVPLLPAAKVPEPEPEPSWEIKATDFRLDRVLERWSQQAGWRLQWDAARHVELSGPNVFRGSFESAVAQVLSTPGIRMSEFPLEGCIYPNTPRLMRITRMGDQVNECPVEFK